MKFNPTHASLALAGSLSLIACLPNPEEPQDEAKTAARTSAASLKWNQHCTGCIMPNYEFDHRFPQYGRQGWTILHSFPTIPPKPLMWNRTNRYDLPFMDIADMDNSVGEVQMVRASTGRVTSFNIHLQTWKDLPAAPKGARKIGVNAMREIAILTNEAKPGGYGIQFYVPSTNSWIDIDGGAIDLDFDNNGDLWVVNDKAWVFVRPKATGIWEGKGEVQADGARAISAGGGRVVVLTNKTANNGYSLRQHTYNAWISIPGELDHINIDAGGMLWGSNNKSVSFWCQL